MFQDDIFPDSSSYRPSLTADEWIRGKNADPILTSLKDGFKPPEQPVVLASVQTEAKSETSVHKPSSDQEYRDAYHVLRKQVERLENETQQKDVIIRQLQQELKSLKTS
eukprot:Sdes_comp20670_c0_seq3m16031